MTNKKRRFQLSLRWKIMSTVTVVAFGVLVVAAIQSYHSNREASRGNFLEKHYLRFDAYRKGLGEAIASATEFLAADPGLSAAMTLHDNAAASVVLERATRVLSRTVGSDLVLLVDAQGEPVPSRSATALPPGETAGMRIVADVVRDGLSLSSELAIIGDHVYQVSGSPIRSEAGTIVGGFLLGERLERYLDDYREQSDSNATKQHRLTLVDDRGRVVASVFPANERADLASALEEGQWQKAKEGDDVVDVISLEGKIFDFHRAAAVGYRGSSQAEIGHFFLMRTRDFKESEFMERVLTSLLLFLGVGIASLLVGLFLSVQITRRIDRYVQATGDLASGRGDLTRRLEVSGSDELGRLAENLNAVFAHTHDLASKVWRAAFQVGASSAEISAASKQMLEGAQEQARKTESSTAAVTELSASIQQVAENAMEATRMAKSSGKAVESAIERMNEIRTTVEEAASRIQELGESGKRIGNIVEVIRQISDQTTLLALNAAIEAAHAGEQGRGFAVVADEVSGLATRVGQSARDIEDLIATIKEQTVEAVRAMETGTHEVEAGTTLVTNTLADLRTLVQVVEDTAKAVQEQAVASDEIARNMDVVQRIAQDVLSSSEEAVEQGEHLHRLAHGLEESVKGFKIDATPAEPEKPALPASSSRGA